MANLYGVEYKKQYVDKPFTLCPGYQFEGAKRYEVVWSYTTTGDEGDGDVLFLGKLPEGAMPIPGEGQLYCEDLGTDVSVKIGYSDDDDALLGATAAGGGAVDTAVPASTAALPNPLSETKDVILTFVDTGNATGLCPFCRLEIQVLLKENPKVSLWLR